MTTLFEELTLGGALESTATYHHRAWCWLPNPHKSKGIPGQEHDGHLSITLQKGQRATSKIERDAYLVQEQPATPDFIGRRFYLLNITDESNDAYEVFVGERDGEGSCTCKAGLMRRHGCKHRDSLRALIALGAFDQLGDRASDSPRLAGTTDILNQEGSADACAFPLDH